MYTKKVTYNSIFENVSQAKDYLLGIFSKKIGKRISEIPEEEKKRILSDPEWIQIRDLNAKTPNYTYLFTKFYFGENAPMEELVSLHADLRKYNQNLKELPMPVEKYGKVEIDEDDRRPGYVRLIDDLLLVERKRALKDLYNEFTSTLKADFKTASDDQIKKLTEITNSAKEKGEECWDSMLGLDPETGKYNLSAYKNLEDFIKFAENFISQYGKSTEGAFYKEIEELGSQVGVLYRDDNYLAVSIRTHKAQTELFGDLGWCITRQLSSFWSYSGGKIQINVFNFSLPMTDKYYATGMTVDSSMKVTDSADRYNKKLPKEGSNISTVMGEVGYPKKVIDGIVESIPAEISIRKSLEFFHRWEEKSTSGRSGIREIAESLVGIEKNIAKGEKSGSLGSYTITKEEWEKISGKVSKIIFEEMGLKRSDFLDIFKENGIYSQPMWNVFDSVVGNEYTSDDMAKIYKATEEGIDDYRYVLTLKNMPNVKENLDYYKSIIAREEDILSDIKKRM
jgi:hypothetical protein